MNMNMNMHYSDHHHHHHMIMHNIHLHLHNDKHNNHHLLPVIADFDLNFEDDQDNLEAASLCPSFGVIHVSVIVFLPRPRCARGRGNQNRAFDVQHLFLWSVTIFTNV